MTSSSVVVRPTQLPKVADFSGTELIPTISTDVALRIQLLVRIPERANIQDPDRREASARQFLMNGLGSAFLFCLHSRIPVIISPRCLDIVSHRCLVLCLVGRE